MEKGGNRWCECQQHKTYTDVGDEGIELGDLEPTLA